MTKASEWIQLFGIAEDVLASADGVYAKREPNTGFGRLIALHGSDTAENMRQFRRLTSLMERYISTFGDAEVKVISSPGRAELLGNYQDNLTLGHTISAAITRDVLVVAGRSTEEAMRIYDTKFDDPLEMKVDHLPDAAHCPIHRWHAIPMGIGKILADKYNTFLGLNAVVDGEVPEGAGCSSSAAFENGLVFAVDRLYDLGMTINQMATVSKRAENEFMGKGCGYLDQISSLVGGVVYISYADPENPQFTRLKKWFDGWSLVTVQVDEGHGGANDLYNSIKPDLLAKEEDIRNAIKVGLHNAMGMFLITNFGDKDAQRRNERGLFYAEEYTRVSSGALCILRGTESDAEYFGYLMDESGNGSRDYLLNTNPKIDEAVALARQYGVYARVHGGGFKGGPIIMTKDPAYMVEVMEHKYGKGCALVHGIREGTCEINLN